MPIWPHSFATRLRAFETGVRLRLCHKRLNRGAKMAFATFFATRSSDMPGRGHLAWLRVPLGFLDQNNLESTGPLFDSVKKKFGPAGLSKKTLASRQPAGCGASRKNHAQNLDIFHHLRQDWH